MSLSFSANSGSFDSLNVRTRCGASRWASRMRCTERRLTPTTLASSRPVQWVASTGGGPNVKSTTRCTVSVDSGGLPGPDHGLGLARTTHDRGGAAASGSGEDDIGTPHVLLRRAPIRDDRLKPTAIC